MAPYSVEFHKGSGRPWKIINKDTKKVVGSSVTKKDAEGSMRARYAAENDTAAKKKKKRTTAMV